MTNLDPLPFIGLSPEGILIEKEIVLRVHYFNLDLTIVIIIINEAHNQ